MTTKFQLQSEYVKKRFPIYFKVANYYRNKRFQIFLDELKVTEETKILDIGGTFDFWKELTKFKTITLINLEKEEENERIKSTVYAGRFIPSNVEFDVVFSNSTIEHVGDFNDQMKFADEIIKCDKNYFIQTPSFWFPYEPHAHILFFQFFPILLKKFLHRIINKSTYPIEELLSIKLLSKRKIKKLFPSARIITERFCSLPKSYYIIGN